MSKHYNVFSNGPEQEADHYAKMMDVTLREYRRIFAYKKPLPQPFTIELYKNQQEFMAREGQGPGVGGFYDGRRIVTYHEKTAGSGTVGTLFHEGTHQFQGLLIDLIVRNMLAAGKEEPAQPGRANAGKENFL